MTTFDPIEGLPDLTGKVALVTGATSGLGFTVSQQLLRKGATVYLAARNESKATGVIARLEAEGLGPGNGKPFWHKLILDHPKGAKESAEEFLTREPRLDILVNNAALLLKRYEMGPLGLQDVVTVNHLSPFIFTNTLLSLMKRTAQTAGSDVRIVNVASSTHTYVSKVQFKTKEDFNGPNKSDGFFSQANRYGFTKLMNMLWTRELCRRLVASSEDGGANIICLSLHPGALTTEGNYETAARMIWPLSAIYRWVMHLFFLTPEEGAHTVVIAAAAPQVRQNEADYRGAYLVPIGKIGKQSDTAKDSSLAKDLWELSERVLAEEGL